MFLLPSWLAQFYVFNTSPLQSPKFVKMGEMQSPKFVKMGESCKPVYNITYDHQTM
jgi:hypothetical protein